MPDQPHTQPDPDDLDDLMPPPAWGEGTLAEHRRRAFEDLDKSLQTDS